MYDINDIVELALNAVRWQMLFNAMFLSLLVFLSFAQFYKGGR